MAVTPTGMSRTRSKGVRGRFTFLLILFSLIFGGGFYCGIRVTRHIAKTGPAFLQPLFGVQGNWLGTPVAVVTPAPAAVAPAAPVAAPVGTANAAPAPVVAPAAPTSSAAAPPVSSGPNTLPASHPAPPANVAAPGTAESLDQNVAEYNATLRRAEGSFHDFMIASQVLANSNATGEERDAANNHTHTAAADLQAYVQRAQTLYDTIHADPLYDKKFKETDRALDPAAVRAQFAELTVDNLRYIRPH